MKENLAAEFRAAGFDLVHVTDATEDAKSLQALQSWLDRGHQAGMRYMAENPEIRSDPARLVPGARSLILVGLNYQRRAIPPEGAGTGRVSAYAGLSDYHLPMKEKLETVAENLRRRHPRDTFKTFVDTSAILERSFAARAGMGFIGKNTLLINKTYGSWIFLGGVITTLSLPADTTTDPGSCGTCRLCLDACPTGALDTPYVLDARSCIAYSTIEHKGAIPPAKRPGIKDWLLGCDICQDVCPHNRSKRFTRHGDFPASGLQDFLQIPSNGTFEKKFKGTVYMRPRRQGMARNACIVAGNSGDPRWVPLLEVTLREESSSMVRECAAWALGELGTAEAEDILRGASTTERDPGVLEAIRQARLKFPREGAHQSDVCPPPVASPGPETPWPSQSSPS